MMTISIRMAGRSAVCKIVELLLLHCCIRDKAEVCIHGLGCWSVIAAHQCKWSPLKQHLATRAPGSWTHIDHPVGLTDKAQIMFYGDNSQIFISDEFV